jgi:hypothetical protein
VRWPAGRSGSLAFQACWPPILLAALVRWPPVWPASRREAEQPQSPLLLELQRPGRRADPPDPAPEFGDVRPDAWFGQNPQAERERCGADVIPLLDAQCQGDGGQIVLAKPPMASRAAGRGEGGVPPSGPMRG